ncbi:MAG TPA: DUF5677 domain-containing protein [Candidatus Acidoferrales bacterium]|nr:DUF5677 domain-containing protein [Candidatus Acidoferrales bacterium]
MEEERIVGIGSAEEQADFLKRHDLFMTRFPNLRRTFEAAFTRQFSSAEPVDRVVFSLGRLCVEDFMEILVLSGNGYGIGALKILRGMYERAITGLYLHVKPEEAENFIDYYWVGQHKLALSVIETFGEESLPKDKLAETLSMYEQIKDRFMVTACRKCETKQLNHTWSKLNFVAMTKVTGSWGNSSFPRITFRCSTPTPQYDRSCRALRRRKMAELRLQERHSGETLTML